MPAGELHYEGVPYADLVFEDVDWSEIDEHDPARRSERKGPANVMWPPSGQPRLARTSAGGCALRAARRA